MDGYESDASDQFGRIMSDVKEEEEEGDVRAACGRSSAGRSQDGKLNYHDLETDLERPADDVGQG